jgi:hypothetical protein
MKYLKPILIVLAVLLGLLLAAAIAIPIIFKPQVLEVVKEEANTNLDATLDFKDLNLSFFRQFPLLTVTLEEISIIGKGKFENLPLLNAQEASLSLNLMDLFKKNAPLKIKHFHLQEPDINILILPGGEANYDITKEDVVEAPEIEAPESTLELSVKDYGISNGRIRYEDQTMPMVVSMEGVNHRGKGDFSSDRFKLDLKTTIDQFNAKYDGTTYLTRANVGFDAILDMDMQAMRFTFLDNLLTVNELSLQSEGYFEMPEENIGMDLRFKAPSTDIRSIWSLIPGAYTEDYANLKTTGSMKLEGWAKGELSDLTYPAFLVDLNVDQGSIQYPDLPAPIDQINLDMTISQPGQTLEATEIDIPKFSFGIRDQTVTGYFSLKDPMVDPDVKAGLKGTINLDDFKQALPLDGVSLSGLIKSDVAIAARMSSIDEEKYDEVDIKGNATITNLKYQDKDQPLVEISSGEVIFSPAEVVLENMAIMAGRSDLFVQAKINNLLAYFHPERTMKGQMKLTSNLLDLDEWSDDETAYAGSAPSTEGMEDISIELPVENFDFAINTTIGKVISDGKTIEQFILIGKAGPKTILLEQLSGKHMSTDFKMDGQIENLLAWMTDDGILEGKVNIFSNNLNLNDFMEAVDTESTNTGNTENEGPIAIPANVKLEANGRFNQVQYTDLILKNVSGNLKVANQKALIESGKAEGLGGKLAFDGYYDASDLKKPVFHFKYELEQIEFKQAFAKLNTFRQLAPVGEYLTGRFNTSMVIDGVMDENMSPVLSSLDAAGFLETYNAIIKGFAPLEGLANKLNIAELKTMDLKNSKNWFSIENGAITLQEFDYNFKDIAMKIGGSHSIEQDMDYRVKMKIPRKYLDKTGITAQANTGLKWLESEASKKGLNLNLGEFVNMAVKIGGTVTQPTYALQVLGTEGEGGQTGLQDQVTEGIKELGMKAKDSLENLARKKVEETKDEIKKQTQQQIDSLKKRANAAIDSTLEKAKQEAAKKAGDEAMKKAEELGGDKAKEEADKIKDKLKKWNPLGGKKE